jgi:hypothetical protein
MKTILLLTALTATLVTMPAIIPGRVRVPAPRVIFFNKKTSKFIKYF